MDRLFKTRDNYVCLPQLCLLAQWTVRSEHGNRISQMITWSLSCDKAVVYVSIIYWQHRLNKDLTNCAGRILAWEKSAKMLGCVHARCLKSFGAIIAINANSQILLSSSTLTLVSGMAKRLKDECSCINVAYLLLSFIIWHLSSNVDAMDQIIWNFKHSQTDDIAWLLLIALLWGHALQCKSNVRHACTFLNILLVVRDLAFKMQYSVYQLSCIFLNNSFWQMIFSQG